jgi:hypothetical protein
MKPSLCAIDVNGANQSQVERDPDGGMSRLFSIALSRGMALQPDRQAQTASPSRLAQNAVSVPQIIQLLAEFLRDTG